MSNEIDIYIEISIDFLRNKSDLMTMGNKCTV